MNLLKTLSSVELKGLIDHSEFNNQNNSNGHFVLDNQNNLIETNKRKNQKLMIIIMSNVLIIDLIIVIQSTNHKITLWLYV